MEIKMEDKKQLSIFCESCSVDLPYPPIALAHFWGQKHRKKCIKIGEKPAIFIPAASVKAPPNPYSF